MENEEMLVQTNETENTETQTVEENVEEVEFTDTQEAEETSKEDNSSVEKSEILLPKAEVNKIIESRLAREKRKYEKESAKKDAIIEALKKGLQKENLDEILQTTSDFYGVDIKSPNGLSNYEEEILGKAEAKEIIDSGLEEMERVADDLGKIPQDKRSIRDNAILNEINSQLSYAKNADELEKNGVKADILEDKNFKSFMKKFNPNETSILEIYQLYSSKETKPVQKTVGSVKSTNTDEVKEFYTPEDVDKLTSAELDDPSIMRRVRQSMLKWNK